MVAGTNFWRKISARGMRISVLGYLLGLNQFPNCQKSTEVLMLESLLGLWKDLVDLNNRRPGLCWILK